MARVWRNSPGNRWPHRSRLVFCHFVPTSIPVTPHLTKQCLLPQKGGSGDNCPCTELKRSHSTAGRQPVTAARLRKLGPPRRNVSLAPDGIRPACGQSWTGGDLRRSESIITHPPCGSQWIHLRWQRSDRHRHHCLVGYRRSQRHHSPCPRSSYGTDPRWCWT